MGNKIYVKNPNQITLYHGSNVPPEKILKEGIIPPPSGEEVRGKRVVFTSPIRVMAEDYGKYLYKIHYNVDLKTAKEVRSLLRRCRAGKETTINDAEIMEMVFESIDPSDIKLVKRKDEKEIRRKSGNRKQKSTK
jgi:hypothetical protein